MIVPLFKLSSSWITFVIRKQCAKCQCSVYYNHFWWQSWEISITKAIIMTLSCQSNFLSVLKDNVVNSGLFRTITVQLKHNTGFWLLWRSCWIRSTSYYALQGNNNSFSSRKTNQLMATHLANVARHLKRPCIQITFKQAYEEREVTQRQAEILRKSRQ